MFSTYNIKELIVFLPEIILFYSSILILLSSILLKRCQKIEFLICISCILLSISALLYLGNNNYEIERLIRDSSISELGYIVNTEKNNLKILTLFLSLLIVLSFWGNYQIQQTEEKSSIKKFKSEYLALITFSCIGIFSSISAGNFISLFVSLELCSFCAYILCAIERKNALASEAATKYFIMGAVMSCISLFGISLLYGINKTGMSIGDYNPNSLLDLSSSNFGNNLSGNLDISYILPIVFILSNLLFKLGLFPFHSVLIDVYQGGPNYVVNFFGSINKIPAIAAIIFIKSIVKIPLAENLCVVLSIISMLFGALGGINQKSVKRILGYSSMLNFGFVTYYLISIDLSDKISLNYLYLYILIYSTSVIGLFSIFSVLPNILTKKSEDVNVSDLSGFYKTHPFLAASFVVFIFSIMGMPPLAGFFVKYNIIKFAIVDNIYFAITALLASVVAGYYYLSIIKTVIFDESTAFTDNAKIESLITTNGKKTNIWPIYLSCILCLIINVFLLGFYSFSNSIFLI
jgi:NADH-quinone oxidoreductase subunit N